MHQHFQRGTNEFLIRQSRGTWMEKIPHQCIEYSGFGMILWWDVREIMFRKCSREKKKHLRQSHPPTAIFFFSFFCFNFNGAKESKTTVMSVRLWKFLKIHRTDQTPAAISAVSAFPVERNMLCALRKLNNPGLPTQEAMPTSKYKLNLRGSIECPRSITKVMLTNKKSRFCIKIYVEGMFANFFLRTTRKNKLWQAKEKREKNVPKKFWHEFFLNQEKYILHSPLPLRSSEFTHPLEV